MEMKRDGSEGPGMGSESKDGGGEKATQVK
jgi:hypothetical protein